MFSRFPRAAREWLVSIKGFIKNGQIYGILRRRPVFVVTGATLEMVNFY